MLAELYRPDDPAVEHDSDESGATRLVVSGERWCAYLIAGAEGGTMTSAESPENVKAVIAGYRPARLTDGEMAELEPLLPQLRDWVLAVAPQTEPSARNLLYLMSRLLLWMSAEYGATDKESVLNRDTFTAFVFTAQEHRADGWKLSARSALNKLRRKLNPDEWDLTAIPLSAPPTSVAYTAPEEHLFRLAAQLPGYRNTTARLWTAAATLGAGLNGAEIAAARVEHLVDLDDGRIGIEVHGARPRLVPIRAEYTPLAADAAEQAGCGRFFSARGANATYDIASRLNDGLSLPRARSTWLSAHLAAGTPVPALQLMAGSLSPKTIKDLSSRIAGTLTHREAAAQGLTP